MAYFTVQTIFNFIIGQGLAARRFTLREALFSPLIWAALLGGALSVTSVQLPESLARPIHIVGGLTIPMMLMALGVSLSNLTVNSLTWPLAFSALRLFGGFALGWAVAAALGLEAAARGVVVMQSAMPVAVYNYMFAATYDNNAEEVAGLVVLSTLMSLFALPLFLLTVM
jgi:predicted permease